MAQGINQNKSGLIWGMFEILVFLFIVVVFIVIMAKYYIHTEQIQIGKFVNPDQNALNLEARSIVVPPSNKTADNVFVLNYHVVTKWGPQDEYDISYDDFKQNMFTLKRNGYQTITLNDFYAYMRGEKQLPDKSFLLTFDDGVRASYYNSDPVLEALNYTAVMFVITGYSLENKSSYYLNQTELQAMQDTGRWELESHTHLTHIRQQIGPNGEIGPALTNKLWLANESRLETEDEYYNRVSADLEKAKYLLETDFNKTITGFALPFGDFGEKGSNYDKAHTILYNLTTGMYKTVFYQFSPTKDNEFRANYPDKKQDSYVSVRLSADILRDSSELLKEIEASRSRELPFVESFENEVAWPRLSGDATFTNNSMILRKGRDDTGFVVMAYLDGSYLWRDYEYSASLSRFEGNSFFLIARFHDYSNYASCKFEEGDVRVMQINGGIASYLNDTHIDYPMVGSNFAIKTQGNTVSCILDGNVVASAQMDGLPSYGGIGVRSEGYEDFDKVIAITNISVNPA